MARDFPWSTCGLTFQTRGELEKVIETLATAGTTQHLVAAKALMHEAISLKKLSADQFSTIKARLHL